MCVGGGNRSIDSGCQNLTTDFYLHVLWTSAAEFPGITWPHLLLKYYYASGMLVTLVIIEIIGRKITMSAEFIGTGLFFGLILICVPE